MSNLQTICKKYPSHVPVIVNVEHGNSLSLLKNKFLVPEQVTVSMFLCTLRRHCSIRAEEALYLYFNNALEPATTPFSTIRASHADDTGAVICTVAHEKTFG